ncbi:MAG: hypothetical protein K5922_03440 [Clostridiales bacterium]|nr:hypothetical protein [Clostridiales bacterium]
MEDSIQYDTLAAENAMPKPAMLKEFDAHVNRNTKDSIFCDLFGRPEYSLQLYQALHPEDHDVKAENIVLVTLRSLMIQNRYNDLGILVKDRLLVLVEAQSTFTENILVRFLIYLADTYDRIINKENLNIYGTKKVKLPAPELYVIYHGDRGDRPDEITLPRDIFGLQHQENIFVDVKAKIIYDSAPGDIINQFITFCRVFDRQIKEHGRAREAVEETLRICKDENVLKEYLRDEEAATIMFTLLDEQKAKRFWEEELRQEGRAEGRAQGRMEGGMEMLTGLVKDKLLSITEASKRAGMTVAEFSKKTGIPMS